ncbi:MAG: hypothetical protein SF029_19550 [bacterium]|nr:hypothetical protein [bacterium]
MSKVKLAAAKELIQEKRYDEARVLLQTINSETAVRWLEKLNTIAPLSVSPPIPRNHAMPPLPPPQAPPQTMRLSTEAERFYQQENRRRQRRRFGSAVQVILMGLGMVASGIFAISLPTYSIPGNPPPDNTIYVILIIVGIVLIFTGVFAIQKRHA